jgi:predicted metalloprotease
MKWRDARRSENVEDRRGMRVGRTGAGIGGAGLLLILLVSLLTGQNPLELLQQVGPMPDSAQVGSGGSGVPSTAASDEAADFVRAVLGDTEDTWGRIFAASGRRYAEPGLVLFTDAVESACGFGSAAVGPFYCPGDSKVYLDLSFFEELSRRFGAPGDFAAAYVVAHEVGHHVQKLLGIEEQVSRLRRRAGETEANALSVRVELQADCFAGVWGHHAARRDLLEEGDVEEGLRAAAAIGDDRLQRRSRGYVTPDSFTHGSSAERVEWLTRGLRGGDLQRCDTFAAVSR